MKKLLALTLFLSVAFASCTEKKIEPFGPIPTQDQLDLQDMEMYAFIHYSLNTYTGQEWGYGNEDPALFNPSQLDVKQWVAACKNAGMKGIIFTAKHHCGFCMWPSEFTDYSVKASPWKDGKGDVVKELSEACKEAGLRFAVYLSPWDRNHPEYGRPEYVTYFRNQLRELLTNYGDIFEVWFDGANGGDGWYGGANETRKIDRLTYYGWDETYEMIREIQPHCIIWNDGANRRGDLRWVGTEAGFIGETNWSLMKSDKDPEWADLHYGIEDGDVWCPGETNTSIRPGWFYHPYEDGQVKTLSKLMDTYYKSVGRNSTLLLNFPVQPNGLISPIDSARGAAFKKMIDEIYVSEIKAQVRQDGQTYTLDFQKPTDFNRVMACEDISLGQRVKKFTLEALVDDQWIPLKDALVEEGDGLTTIGRKRIICFPTVTATKLRMTIKESKVENPTPTNPEAVITRLAAFLASDISVDIPDSGEKFSTSLKISIEGDKAILVDLEGTKTVKGFRYLPPQQQGASGIIKRYVFHALVNGEWKQLSEGEFSNIVNNPIWQGVNNEPVQATQLRIEAAALASGERVAYEDIEILTE